MARQQVVWVCVNCDAQAPRWQGRCNECGQFGTLSEETSIGAGALGSAGGSARAAHGGPVPEVTTLKDACGHEPRRQPTNLTELDRVLGGGFVEGSLVLLGGEPGVGKSTLLLQAADSLARSGAKIMYVCGEESPAQIGLRASRLGLDAETVSLLPQTDGVLIERAALEYRPDLIIIDSIQTITDPDIESTPGSVNQVRATCARLMRLAKEHGMTVVVVGHVTKDGSLAGPRVLEHMVDTVLYFEGDASYAFRIIRAVKNRFGASDEIGIFEMGEKGLTPVASPSQAFVEARDESVAGSALFAAMEGSRPLLVEIQALVTPSYQPLPRRLATGLDANRLLQVIAVLERHGGVSFAGLDVIVSVAGGIRLTEPALDLPLACALYSALKDRPLSAQSVAFGEVSLTGAVRVAPAAAARTKEAHALGMTNIIGADTLDSVRQISCSVT
ncbi:MAG: DNA repair protein RadA [Coriobacteriia bacterium]|nr:DNA repair protein RadA [Coriobacteriia bacterium]